MATYPAALDEVKFVKLYGAFFDWLPTDVAPPEGHVMNPLTVPWKYVAAVPDALIPDSFADWDEVAIELPVPPPPSLGPWTVTVFEPADLTVEDTVPCGVLLQWTDGQDDAHFPPVGQFGCTMELWATSGAVGLVETIDAGLNDGVGQFYAVFAAVGVGNEGNFKCVAVVANSRYESVVFEIVGVAP